MEKVLAGLDLGVEPFAVCDLRRRSRLSLAGPRFVVLHFVLEGEGVLLLSGREELDLATDMLVVVPPGVRHAFRAGSEDAAAIEADESAVPRGGFARIQTEGTEPGLLMACGRVEATYGGVTGLFDRLKEPLVEDFTGEPAVRVVFEALLREQDSEAPGARSMMTALMNQIFVVLLRRLCDSGECVSDWLSALADERLGPVLDAIMRRPEQPHSVESLAILAGMSRTSFTERFGQVFGRPPMTVLREARMRRAAELLESEDLPVKTIAARVGFSSRSRFTEAFTAQYGQAPAEYRASRTAQGS